MVENGKKYSRMKEGGVMRALRTVSSSTYTIFIMVDCNLEIWNI